MTLHHITFARRRASHRSADRIGGDRISAVRIPTLDQLESPRDRRAGRRMRWRWPSLEGWLSLRAW